MIQLVYPPSMTFWQALQGGQVPPWRKEAYLVWVRELACVGCRCKPAGDAHHVVGHGLKGAGTKTPDILTFPLCRRCHLELHRSHVAWEANHGTQLDHALRTIVEAVHTGVLGW